jgi:hypothetical protein
MDTYLKTRKRDNWQKMECLNNGTGPFSLGDKMCASPNTGIALYFNGVRVKFTKRHGHRVSRKGEKDGQ